MTTQPSPKHRKEAREPERLYVQVLSGGSVAAYERDPREVHDNGKPVYEYIPASLLSARDQEIREVLAGLATSVIGGNLCWCPDPFSADEELHDIHCLAARALYEKVQVVKEGNDGE